MHLKNLLLWFRTEENGLQAWIPYQYIFDKILINIENQKYISKLIMLKIK